MSPANRRNFRSEADHFVGRGSYSKFPKFVKNRFHVSGESYAGRYIPVIGAKINQANKNLPTKNSIHVPLE